MPSWILSYELGHMSVHICFDVTIKQWVVVKELYPAGAVEEFKVILSESDGGDTLHL